MQFADPRLVEDIVYAMRQADFPRNRNRARIDSLCNGDSPYTPEQERLNNIEVNVNDLSHTRLTHDARLQLYQGFNKPGNFFTCRTDSGPVSRRTERGQTVTRDINRRLKRSNPYFECQRSQLALNVLHGIGPAIWNDSDRWSPDPLGIEDVLVPGRTLTSFDGLPFIAIYRNYSAQKLMRLTRKDTRDRGWNMRAVAAALKWVDSETQKMLGTSESAEFWSPQRVEERRKDNDGAYASDLCPTIDCWDFYHWSDDAGQEGWRRKIIFDAEGGYKAWQTPEPRSRPTKNLIGDTKGRFLFDGGDRVWGRKLEQIVHFQFADLSAKAPFRYHGVRSLGWMLYAICHLQNRLNCKTWEAVFETLMPYMRVDSSDAAERALKVTMASRGIVDSTVHFLGAEERWAPNPVLVELGMAMGSRILNENSASWVQNQNFSRDRVEKTKFQVMAEINAMMTLVSAALQQAYRYQASQYREIVRRFMRPGSCDPDVRDFRACVLAQGVPEKLLDAERWDVEPERVMGSGNKTLEMAIAQQLMEWRAAYSPAAQQEILRLSTLSVTDDPALSANLVPRAPVTSDTAHDAMAAFGSLMAGGHMDWKEHHSRVEIAETLLAELATAIPAALRDGEATMEQVEGYENVIAHVSDVIAHAVKDEPLADRVKELAQASGKLANEVALLRKQAEAKRASQNGNGRIPPETLAKIESDHVSAEAKAANTRESHAARTAQKQLSHELQLDQSRQKHEQDLAAEAERSRLDLEVQAAESALSLETKAAETALQLDADRKKAEAAAKKPAPDKPAA